MSGLKLAAEAVVAAAADELAAAAAVSPVSLRVCVIQYADQKPEDQ